MCTYLGKIMEFPIIIVLFGLIVLYFRSTFSTVVNNFSEPLEMIPNKLLLSTCSVTHPHCLENTLCIKDFGGCLCKCGFYGGFEGVYYFPCKRIDISNSLTLEIAWKIPFRIESQPKNPGMHPGLFHFAVQIRQIFGDWSGHYFRSDFIHRHTYNIFLILVIHNSCK